MNRTDEHFAANAEMDDEELRFDTDFGTAQIAFCLNRVEETRIKMLEAKHLYWVKGGLPYLEWKPYCDRYWVALDNYEAAKQDLWRARKNVQS